jgi:drug/metabolite transporter (DMT)-like permease
MPAITPDIDVFGHDLSYHVSVPAQVVALAVASSLCFAFASASQHVAAQSASPEQAMRPGLIVQLAHRPLWVLGNVADVAGFVFMFLSFRHGTLALIEPLLVSAVLFALLFGALLSNQRVRRQEWASASLVVVGLSTFLVAASPGGSRATASQPGWACMCAVTVGITGVLVVLAGRYPRRRAALLGAAAGVVNGALGTFTDAAAHAFNAGVAAALHRWEPYALVVVGAASLIVVQTAFQAGPLSQSLPLLTSLEALSGIAAGQLLFGEHVAGYWVARAFEIVGLALLCAGIAVLARSPLVAGRGEPVEGAVRAETSRPRAAVGAPRA